MKNKKMESKFFELNDSDNINEFIEKIRVAFTTTEEKPKIKNQLYFDTFDWKLLRKDLTLFRESQNFYLSSLDNKVQIDKIEVNKKNSLSFWQDFPDSTLKEKLKTNLSIRAITQIINLETREKVIKILNDNEKTVVMVSLNKVYRFNRSNKIFISNEVRVIPIRGYEDEFAKVVDFMPDLGLKETKKNLISSILEDKKNKSGNYTGKLNITLTREMTATDAAKTIFFDLVKTVKQNEDGIKKNIDTEFLHDFRVAVRRIRSALTQIKEVFPEKDVKRFKKNFAILGKNTNRLRDLDVYLLEKEKYTQMLSDDLSSGLETVFTKLTHERKTEQKKLTRFIKTEKYKKIIINFETYLEKTSSDSQNAPNSNVKILELACRFIWKKYNQILKKGRKINDSTPDPVLHELRIECKKLRYLLEFFSSLFPENETSIIIKHLKKLQDNLGDFNDLYVQQQSLKEMLNKFDTKPDQLKQVSASIGGLIAILFQKQKDVRKEFSKSFGELDNEDSSKLFRKLFYIKSEMTQ